jgi:3',5'-cyclic-AMP phosphodiesterase
VIRGGAADVRVFAVEDTAAQVCWRELPAGTVLRAGDASAEVAAGGDSPGATVLAGLAPGRRYSLTVTRPGQAPEPVGAFSTLAPPPGRELCRFATVNDVHVGEPSFGVLRTIREPRRRPGSGGGYATRCLTAALAEARAWGAQALVVKGDLTWQGRAREWEEVAGLLGAAGIPVAAVAGNHDVGSKAVDGRRILAAHGIEVPDHPFSLDLPGIRIVLAHSAVARRSHGHVDEVQRAVVADLVAGAPAAAFVGLHHYLHRFGVPLSYPPGIAGAGADALLDALAEANSATLVSSGHSHRNRRRTVGPLVVTQVGATMHYPGVWAGYAVHEGGIRQVVRRVAEPSAIAWTERTAHALLGGWRLWATGLRSHRCFSHPWPARADGGPLSSA